MCSETHSIEQKLCVRDLSKSQSTSCKISTTKHGRANQISDHLSRSCKILWDFGRSFEMCKSAPILEVSWDILQDVMQKGYGNAQIRDLSSKDPQTTSVFRRVRAIAAESQDVFVELSLTGEPIGESIGGGGRTGQGVGLLADVVGHYNDSANMRERHALQTSMLLVDDATERVRLCHSE
jgi:hypothetical protein